MNDDTISRQAAKEYCAECDHNEVCRWYPYEGCEFRSLPSAQPEQRWIPVTEGLPRECTRVIGYMAWKAMNAIEYQHGRWYSIDHLEPLPDEAVSHWMPLPQPPKEGDE